MRTLTQPIGIRDVIAYLRRAPFVEGARGREIEIGGPEAMTPFEVVDRMALALGRPPPRRPPGGGWPRRAPARAPGPRGPLRAPGATRGAVAAGAGAVTRGDGAIAA